MCEHVGDLRTQTQHPYFAWLDKLQLSAAHNVEKSKVVQKHYEVTTKPSREVLFWGFTRDCFWQPAMVKLSTFLPDSTPALAGDRTELPLAVQPLLLLPCTDAPSTTISHLDAPMASLQAFNVPSSSSADKPSVCHNRATGKKCFTTPGLCPEILHRQVCCTACVTKYGSNGKHTPVRAKRLLEVTPRPDKIKLAKSDDDANPSLSTEPTLTKKED
jgi:hypothetical protein